MCVLVYVFKIFSEITGPIETKLYVESQWNRRVNLIQIIHVICCSLLLSAPPPPWAGASSRDFTTQLAPQCRAFSGTLKVEKLKAPLFPGPKGLMGTSDWCSIVFCSCKWKAQIPIMASLHSSLSMI